MYRFQQSAIVLYTEDEFRPMLVRALRGDPLATVARDAGFPGARDTLRRYRDEINGMAELLRPTPDETLAARLAYVAGKVEVLKEKGSDAAAARKIFSVHERAFFARALKLYAELGWPMHVKQIARMFTSAAKETSPPRRVNGHPWECSESYVREFLKDFPELRTYKASNIDPICSKKATAQVWMYQPCSHLQRRY